MPIDGSSYATILTQMFTLPSHRAILLSASFVGSLHIVFILQTQDVRGKYKKSKIRKVATKQR